MRQVLLVSLFISFVLSCVVGNASAASTVIGQVKFSNYSAGVELRLASKTPSIHTGYSIGTCSTTAAIDTANGEDQYMTLGGTCTATVALVASGKSSKLFLRVIQGASPYTLALKYTGGTAVKWAGGTAPTITTTASAIDVIACRVYNTYVACSASQDLK